MTMRPLAYLTATMLTMALTSPLAMGASDNPLNKTTSMQPTNLAVPEAAEFGATLAGTPCRVINPIGKKMIYQPPGLDHPVLVLNSCIAEKTAAAVFVDLKTGKSTVVPLPHGSGGWAVIETSPGKLLFESLEPLSLITIDTTGGNYKVESVVDVEKNIYAWTFTKGPDGQIYFGSYPTSHLYRYNPATREVTDLGQIGPDENLYVRHAAYDDSGYILCDVIVSKPGIFAYNVATGKQVEVVPGVSAPLDSIGGRVYASLNGLLHEFDGASMKFVPATIAAPPGGLAWRNISPSSTPERLLVIANDGTWWEVKPGLAPRQVWNQNLKGGGIVGFWGEDKVVAYRGQEYGVAKTLAQGVDWKQATDSAIPVHMHFITADPKGGVTGGPSFGQTLFRFDPARKLEQNTGQVVEGGGEVYGGKWLDGKFHFVSYSGGYQAVWDPEKPWDQINNNNPKTLLQYNTPEYGTMIRPIGNMIIGPGTKLYSGWSGQYGVTNGMLAEFDPATNKARHWGNALFAENMSIGKVVSDGKYIYGLTSNEFSGILPEHKPISFWVFDPVTEKVLFQKKLDMTLGANLVSIPDTKNIWLADKEGVHRFEPKTMNFAQTIPWPENIGKVVDVNSADARNANAWFASDVFIVKLADGKSPRLTTQFKMKMSANIAAGYDKKLYFTQRAELWSAPLK